MHPYSGASDSRSRHLSSQYLRILCVFHFFPHLRCTQKRYSQSGFADVQTTSGTTKVHLSNEAECAALGDVDNRLGKVPKTGEHLLSSLSFCVLSIVPTSVAQATKPVRLNANPHNCHRAFICNLQTSQRQAAPVGTEPELLGAVIRQSERLCPQCKKLKGFHAFFI